MIIFPYFLTDIYFVLQWFLEPLLQVNKIQIALINFPIFKYYRNDKWGRRSSCFPRHDLSSWNHTCSGQRFLLDDSILWYLSWRKRMCLFNNELKYGLNPRNDCSSFHDILDANQTGEALFDILQQWCLRWNDLWYVKTQHGLIIIVDKLNIFCNISRQIQLFLCIYRTGSCGWSAVSTSKETRICLHLVQFCILTFSAK